MIKLLNMVHDFKAKVFFLAGIIFLASPFFVSADYVQQKNEFFINPSYDLKQRKQIVATLEVISPNIYFYVDSNWWKSLSYDSKVKIKTALQDLGQEFKTKIYPDLTSIFGSEWSPGIDNDKRITVLIFPMKKVAGGYFNSADEYQKLEIPISNEREMVYLNSDYVTSSLEDGFLAHEFMHLISFNQKDRTYGVSDDTWLNEARSEISITLLGYNNVYKNSNLQNRVTTFLEKPDDSLTEWENTPYDYGVLNLFTQYLIEHYGVNVLVDSLHSPMIGINSINYALKKEGFHTDFSQIFEDWTIATLVNDCSLDAVSSTASTSSTSSVSGKYCYKNSNLKNFRVIPVTNFLPFMGNSVLHISGTIKEWSGNWYRITGGRNILRLDFTGSSGSHFRIPYVVQNIKGKNFVRFLHLDKYQRGTIYVPSFGSNNTSLTIIPSIEDKTSGFGRSEPTFNFSWTASTVDNISFSTSSSVEIFSPNDNDQYEEQMEELTRDDLIKKIAEIENQIRLLQIQLIKLLQQKIAAIQNQIAVLKSKQ